MNRLIVLFSFATWIFVVGALAQTKDSIAMRYANTITALELNEHLTVLASDNFEGRETGEKGEKLAAFYLAGEFAAMGIAPFDGKSYFQAFPLEKFQPDGKATIAGTDYHFIKDFVYFNAARQEFEINELIFAGYGIESENYNDFEEVDVEGKSVLVFGGEPSNHAGISHISEDTMKIITEEDIFVKMEIAERKKIKHLFIAYDDYTDRIAPYEHFFNSVKMQLRGNDPGIIGSTMVFIISKEMAEAVFSTGDKKLSDVRSKIKKRGKPQSFSLNTSIKMDTKSKMVEVEGLNVLGYIEGSDLKDEVVIVTAHYDHLGKHNTLIYNGADDNATGTAGLIEIAESFAMAKKDGYGPRRSILIMPVSGEEKGLLGSKFYTDNPVFPLENTICNLNIDMIGRTDKSHENDSNYIYLIGSDRLSTDLHNLSEWANSTYVDLDLDYTFNKKNDPNNFYLRSDHYNFARKKIPVIFYFSGIHEDYH